MIDEYIYLYICGHVYAAYLQYEMYKHAPLYYYNIIIIDSLMKPYLFISILYLI